MRVARHVLDSMSDSNVVSNYSVSRCVVADVRRTLYNDVTTGARCTRCDRRQVLMWNWEFTSFSRDSDPTGRRIENSYQIVMAFHVVEWHGGKWKIANSSLSPSDWRVQLWRITIVFVTSNGKQYESFKVDFICFSSDGFTVGFSPMHSNSVYNEIRRPKER